MAKVLHVKKKSGRKVKVTPKTVKRLFKTIGFSGRLLIHATEAVFREGKKLASSGVISGAGLEKAVVRAVVKTNDIAMGTALKIAKKVLK